RNHKTSANSKLVDKNIRDIRRPCGDDDSIERSLFLPPDRTPLAVVDPEYDIEQSQRIEALSGAQGQRSDTFLRANTISQGGQNGGLITGAGADLQHLL